jgi:hypothetical protein
MGTAKAGNTVTPPQDDRLLMAFIAISYLAAFVYIIYMIWAH